MANNDALQTNHSPSKLGRTGSFGGKLGWELNIIRKLLGNLHLIFWGSLGPHMGSPTKSQGSWVA